MAPDDPAKPAAERLRRVFDSVQPLTVGLEEEVVLLDAGTLDLAPVAHAVAARSDGRFKPELPAAQLELVTAPVDRVGEAIAQLSAARRELAAAVRHDGVRPAALAVHPFAGAVGELTPGDRYAAIEARYGQIARRQLVGALQVHVAVGGARRTIAVHDAVRSYLPLLAGLAAAAPFYEGGDTGLASIRPSLGRLLPRQGVPPVLGSVEAFAAALGVVGDDAQWWWEVRPHPVHGTLELRVPDVQPWLADAAAVVAVAHALVAWLAERCDAGDLPAPEATWRIDERRWLAARHGAAGPLAEDAAALIDAGAAARLRPLGPRGAASAAVAAFCSDRLGVPEAQTGKNATA
jgi:glutamate---cysteine ligase / carboxylate-amine ligase